MTRYAIPSGTTVFKLGDRAETIYLLSEGTIEFTELGVSLGPQMIFGEVGRELDIPTARGSCA